MGYRLRIGKISKKAAKKYMEAETEEEVRAMARLEDGDGVYRSLPEYKEMYEIGKYVDHSKGTLPFFKFKLEENDFSIAPKDWLLALIDHYRDKTQKWYAFLAKAIVEAPPSEGSEKIEGTNLLTLNNSLESNGSWEDFPDVQLYRFINNRADLWACKYVSPFVLEPEDGGVLTRDWSYEYSVFNLVHILHTFDWKKDYLIYSGW